MNKLTKKTNDLSVLLLKSVLNVLRSASFNLFMLVLGFCLGYYVLAMKVHYYATTHNYYEYVEKIMTHVKQLEEMDSKYSEKQQDLLTDLKRFKLRMSHEIHHECDSKIGTVLYK